MRKDGIEFVQLIFTVTAKRKKEKEKKERAVTAQLMGKLRHDMDFLEKLMIHPGLTKGQVQIIKIV